MKKRLIMILAMTMCMFLCACGGSESTSGDNKEEGFTPSQATEKEETENKDDTTIAPDSMTVEQMKEYYDTEKFVGTPRLETCNTWLYKDKELRVYTDWRTYKIEPFKGYVDKGAYYVIFTDNNTPDDVTDDELAYLFTTPVE